jgi:hypothetical protein
MEIFANHVGSGVRQEGLNFLERAVPSLGVEDLPRCQVDIVQNSCLGFKIDPDDLDVAQVELLALVDIDREIGECGILIELSIRKSREINVPLRAVQTTKFVKSLQDGCAAEDVARLDSEYTAQLRFRKCVGAAKMQVRQGDTANRDRRR